MIQEPESAPENQTVPTFVIDGDALGCAEALARFQSAVAGVFEVTALEPGGPTVSAETVSWHLGPVMLGVFDGPPLAFERPPSLVAASGLDHLLIQLYVRGGFEGVAGAEPMKVEPGDVCILDLQSTLSTRSTAFSNISLLAPRSSLRDHVDDLAALHGTVLPAGAPMTALLADHLMTLSRKTAELASPQAVLAADATLALAGAVIASVRPERTRAPPVRGVVSDLRRVSNYVEAHIGETDLSAARVAAGVGLSRAALYRVCAPVGGVATLIRRRRLAGAALDLADPACCLRIGEIARRWGFSDETTFARAFRAAFHVPPREARRRGASPGLIDAAGVTREQEFAEWIRTLRPMRRPRGG